MRSYDAMASDRDQSRLGNMKTVPETLVPACTRESTRLSFRSFPRTRESSADPGSPLWGRGDCFIGSFAGGYGRGFWTAALRGSGGGERRAMLGLSGCPAANRAVTIATTTRIAAAITESLRAL